MKEQIERILADADYPETKLEKTVSINFDGRQYFIRIPKKLSDYLKLTSTNKIKITIDIPYIEKIRKKIMVVEIIERQKKKT